MSTALAIVQNMLLISFVLCCVFSGVLQVLAWSMHARQGAPSLKALREPEHFFDPIGVRQIHLARRLLIVGVAAYLSYGFLLAVGMVLG